MSTECWAARNFTSRSSSKHGQSQSGSGVREADSDPTSLINSLCELGQVAYLSLSLSSSVEWDDNSHGPFIAIFIVERTKCINTHRTLTSACYEVKSYINVSSYPGHNIEEKSHTCDKLPVHA